MRLFLRTFLKVRKNTNCHKQKNRNLMEGKVIWTSLECLDEKINKYSNNTKEPSRASHFLNRQKL